MLDRRMFAIVPQSEISATSLTWVLHSPPSLHPYTYQWTKKCQDRGEAGGPFVYFRAVLNARNVAESTQTTTHNTESCALATRTTRASKLKAVYKLRTDPRKEPVNGKKGIPGTSDVEPTMPRADRRSSSTASALSSP